MKRRELLKRGAVTAGAILLTTTANAQRSSVRDSAGVRIIYSESPAWTPAQQMSVDPTPTLVIGTQAGKPYELSGVASAARLSDGRIVVADGGSLQLRFYDARGTFLKSAGGRGQGPGEFRRIMSMERLRGDTLVVAGGSGIVQYFDGQGKYAATVNYRMQPPVDLPPGIWMTIGAFPNRTTVMTSAIAPTPHARGQRWAEPLPMLIADHRNTTIRKIDGYVTAMYAMENEPVSVRFQPPISSASAEDVVYVGVGHTYSINGYAADGRLVRIIRRQWTPIKVTQADIDTFVVEWGKRWIKSADAAAEKQRADMRAGPYAATLPAFSQLIVDHDQRLWVRNAELHDTWLVGEFGTRPYATSRWSVFGRDGVWLGDVRMPPRFHPRDIGPDYVLGIAWDNDGVETVVQYRLRTR